MIIHILQQRDYLFYCKSNNLTDGGTVPVSRGESLPHHVVHFTRVMIFNCGKHHTPIYWSKWAECSILWPAWQAERSIFPIVHKMKRFSTLCYTTLVNRRVWHHHAITWKQTTLHLKTVPLSCTVHPATFILNMKRKDNTIKQSDVYEISNVILILVLVLVVQISLLTKNPFNVSFKPKTSKLK
jgi:hypothetical protein